MPLPDEAWPHVPVQVGKGYPKHLIFEIRPLSGWFSVRQARSLGVRLARWDWDAARPEEWGRDGLAPSCCRKPAVAEDVVLEHLAHVCRFRFRAIWRGSRYGIDETDEEYYKSDDDYTPEIILKEQGWMTIERTTFVL